MSATRRRRVLNLALGLAAVALVSTPCLAQRTSVWNGGTGNWFGPSDTCVSWNTCSGPGTNPGESGFIDNVFINAPGSDVTLNGGAAIANLTMAPTTSMTIINTGYVDFVGSGSATLTNGGNITLANASGIEISGVPSPATLALTITGGGTITMGTASAHVGTVGGFGSLINQETIQGQGSILTAGTITNQAVVDGNVPGGTLYMQPSNAGWTNTGTLEASGGGTLDLVTGFSSIVLDNTGGTIQALDGSTVLIQAGVINGGTLTTSGTGVIQTVGASPTLQNLTNAGTYQILPGGTTILQGAINNTGTFLVGSGTGGSQLQINGTVTLSGGGNVTLVDSGNPLNTITSFTPGSQLINQQTIQGTGTIGDVDLTILNQGIIDANSATHSMTFTDAGFDNQGTVEATNGAALHIFSPAFNNQGTLNVGAGSTIDFDGNYNLLNYNAATNTLTGGSYIVGAGGTLQFNNAANGIVAINTNAANIVLNGLGSQILNAVNGDALAGLATNAAGGSFTIENGRNFTTSGDFQNSGTLTVGNGSTFTTGGGASNNYTQSGAGSLTDVQNGANFDTSTFNQSGGLLRVDAGGKVTATNFNFTGGTLAINGNLDPLSLTICTACTLMGSGTVTANVTSNGMITPGASSTSPGTLTITGNYTQNAGGALTIDLGGTAAGQFGVLDVSGSAALNGTLDFTAVNGFTPGAGDDFTFLLFGSESGDFSNVVFTNWSCPTQDTCTDVFGAGTLTLEIAGTTTGGGGGSGGGGTPTPEPGSVLLLGIGLAGLAALRKRSKSAEA